MSQRHYTFFFLILLPFLGFPQRPLPQRFKVIGFVNQDTGTVKVEMSEARQLYPESFKELYLKISNGKFSFSGNIEYPVWLSFRIGEKYVSDRTPITFGKQTIRLDTGMVYQEPSNDNHINGEKIKFNSFKKQADLVYTHYRNNYDSLKVIYPDKFPDELEFQSRLMLKESYLASDQALLQFISANPDSYYGMYKLYHLVDFGYNSQLEQCFAKLSDRLKESPIGKHLASKIAVARQTSVGEKLPEFAVAAQNGEKLDMGKFKDSKFVLIDLWYSHCAPCIAQFSELKAIYSQFSKKGFEMIAISTDRERFVEDWKSVIAKHSLPWHQFLDLNGVEARKLNVKIYPTSFLLDNNGTIVASDISPIELKYFLMKNLN